MTARIEGQRLDIVLQRLRETEVPSTITRLEQSEALKKSAKVKRVRDRHSAETLLTDYVMPLISNPAIFQDHNLIMILEHLRDVVLPELVDNVELTDIAVKVINDEVARHKFVQERRLEEIAS